MNFYAVTKKFEDMLLDLGYSSDWDYNYLCFYICGIKCFYVDFIKYCKEQEVKTKLEEIEKDFKNPDIL